ncbi:MAG: hypothetical protein H6741_05295 [Alphaproteobacteria bacterium]|nr:hypothetical protein [Alphaproteobacteria bacterium]MCB9792122.1 hypothetical protein [Alphaproteobacteria bacterium]
MNLLAYPGADGDAVIGLLGLLGLLSALVRPAMRRRPLLLALAWAALGRGFVALELPMALPPMLGLIGGSWVAWLIWEGIRGRASGVRGLAMAPALLAVALCWMAPMASVSTLGVPSEERRALFAAASSEAEVLPWSALEAEPGRIPLGGPPVQLTEAPCGEVVRWWVSTQRRMGGHRKITEKSTLEYTRLGESRVFIEGRCEGTLEPAVLRVTPNSGLTTNVGVAEPIALRPVPSRAALQEHLNLTRWIHGALPLMVLLSLIFHGGRRDGDAGRGP